MRLKYVSAVVNSGKIMDLHHMLFRLRRHPFVCIHKYSVGTELQRKRIFVDKSSYSYSSSSSYHYWFGIAFAGSL
jgi:hypothetical protein